MKPIEIFCLLCVIAFVVGAWLIPIGLYTKHIWLVIAGPAVMGLSLAFGVLAVATNNPQSKHPLYSP